MSDATPTKKSAKGWTDIEKLGLLFQIIEKAGTIPWSTIDLPEGRTVKGCSVMVDKEKAKVRKAKEAAANGEAEGEEGGMTAATTTPKSNNKKRAAIEEAAPGLSAKKTTRTPRKSKKAIQAEADAAAEAAEAAEAGEDNDDDEETVKAEVFE